MKQSVSTFLVIAVGSFFGSVSRSLADNVAIHSPSLEAAGAPAVKEESLKSCDGPTGASTKSEIQRLVLQYESNLSPATPALRVRTKQQLFSLMTQYDRSCFAGIADLSTLCAELSYDHSIKTSEGLSVPFSGGYRLVKRQLQNGKYSASWQLLNSKNEILAFVSDKNKDGLMDTVYLSGAFETKTSESTRKVMGMDSTIVETNPGFAAGTQIDLNKDPHYIDLFGAQVPAARTCAFAGDPAQVLGLVASNQKWNPRDAQITWDKKLSLYSSAAHEGAQHGARGLLKGVETAGVSTWNGLSSLVTGPWAYATNATTRLKVNSAVGDAFSKAGTIYSKTYSQCSAEHSGSFVTTMMCMELRLGQAEVSGAGSVLKAIGTQLKKCWTGEGAAFQDEYFSECMGQVVFYAGSSIVGGGMVSGGAKIAASGAGTAASTVAKVAGRTSAIVGEYVVDQTGLGTMGAAHASGEAAEKVAKDLGEVKPADWVPPNQPSSRHAGTPDVPHRDPELPGFVDPSSKGFVRQGIAFGPGDKFQAAFNPTAFVAKDKDGKEKVFMVIRGEKEVPNAEWKRHSLPYLASSDDGVHFKMVQEDPLFQADSIYDKVGGIEDPRYADFRLQPVVMPDGKSYDGAIMYTAYDGKTARVAAALFNHDSLGEFRKVGPIFKDADLLKNPLVPENPAWNKSPAPLQFKDPKTGKIRNILYVGEGNQHHGGIMAIESDKPMSWTWPENQKPVIQTRPGFYDQNLVEPAFQPVIAPLPKDLAEKTGQTQGIYVSLHGDAPPQGYQVGYRIFALDNPTGKPIFESAGPFLWPQEKYEIEGQVGKVVFASGSVEFKGQRFIYYGAADKYIGVASAPARK